MNPEDTAPMREPLQPKLNQLPKGAKQHPILSKYYATSDGKVINSNTNRALNGTRLHAGLAFNPFIDNIKLNYKFFDKLVYECFKNIILEPNIYIKHLDGNPLNNNIFNLKTVQFNDQYPLI